MSSNDNNTLPAPGTSAGTRSSINSSSRRRQQASTSFEEPPVIMDNAVMHNNNHTPTYRMGSSLVHARISPMASGSKRHFFPSSSSRLSTGSAMNAVSAAAADNKTSSMDVFVDGMNLSYLRKLTKSCLGESAGTSLSPSMAVFYASILHSKTKSYNDAFLYGQALFQNHDYKRCVEWMENSGLLQCSCSSSSSNNNNFPSLQLESILLTATALLKLQDWNAILALLEETHLYASVVGYDTHSLQDDDDIAWMTLKENISALIPSNNDIHPLARICAIRGRAYSELGHPLRAAHFWKKALHIDPTCVDALEGLVLRNAVNPHEALAIVLGLEFDASENLEWLRALYLARVHVAAPTSSNIPDSSAAAEALATSMSMEHSINPQESPIEHNGENQHHAHNNITAANHDRQAVAPGTHHEPTGMIAVESTGEPFTPFAQQPGASFLFSGRANDSHQDRDESYTAIYQTRNNPVTAASRAAEHALDKLVSTYKLQESPEVLAMAAQQAFGRYQFHKCLQCCQALIQCNSMQGKAAFCYVSTLVQLRQKRTLFRLAHEWVEAAPKEARSWFAVGAYYYACQRYHVAQRHFCRATRLDPQCAEAWIAFGASFAACDESDQALASFRAAQRIAPGHHVSLLYIGMEYLRTNHLVLAQHFLLAAHDSCHGTDALAMSELGVLNMHQKKYDHAIAWFLQALGANTDVLRETEHHHPKSLLDAESLEGLVDAVHDEYWEPTLFNLAHAYRKERFFEHAIVCLERCLALKESSSAYSALGFCLHLQSMSKPALTKEETNLLLQQAIDTYHQALAKKPDAAFCSEMLTKALGNTLEMRDFFVDDQDVGDGNGCPGAGLSDVSASGILKQDESSFFSPPKRRAGTSSGGVRTSSISMEQSSMEEALSLSLESNSDVDMS